jgi:3-oxoacyl-[acyl-carrier protein] reductase
MSDLTGKTAIVTGGGRGIGAAIVRYLADRGAAIAINDITPGAAAALADEILAKGGKAIAVQGDVSRAADVDRLFAESEAAFGKPDILVANAARIILGPIEEVTEESYRASFDTNVWGLILLGQQAKHRFGANGGSFIALGSAVTELPDKNAPLYGATKAAIEHITRALALDLGPLNVRVNAVLPGLVETEGLHALGGMNQPYVDATIARTPLGRLGNGEDVARVVAFLASDEARWVTGQRIGATGGLY